jgi:Thiol:disulfide interchange protein
LRLATSGVVSRAAAICLVVLAFGVAAVAARAASAAGASAWSETDHGRVRLVAGTTGTGTGAAVPLGLQFDMAPGWKVYWRSPGDAGFPPRIDWAGSANLAEATILWPAPTRFTVLGFETIGYEDAVLLPIDARLARPGEPLHVAASVDYLTCKDICVPYRAQFELSVPTGPATAGPYAADIARFAARVPPVQPTTSTGGGGTLAGLAVESATLAEGRESLVVAVRAANPLRSPDVFVEGPAELAFGAPQVTRGADGLTAVMTVPVLADPAAIAALPGSPLTLTVVDGDRAVERTAVVGAGTTSPSAVVPPAAAARSFAAILLLALAGGLILNLMPCVLPVLSIKLLAVVGHGGGDRREVRRGFLAAAAGILVSFLILAAALIALRMAGIAAGWGVQFQQPWFLIAMTLVVMLFACNLWGLFELSTPQAVAAVDARAARVRGLGGHFLTGALATLLATPCTAPFVGTAIGFALSGSPLETVLVFIALAVGLAIPYLAVAAVPSLATRLPRPGPWMVWLRRVLGIVLAGTAVWLLSILAAGRGTGYAVAVGAVAVAMVVMLAVGRTVRSPRLRRLAPVAAVVLGAAAFLIPAPSGRMAIAASEHGWLPLAPESIPALVASGRTVYVNVTADWCLTCKVNERLVLARDPVASRLGDGTVVTMRGDWTQPDEGIARYLAGFGRYGIPFDAVYGPALPRGEALPELLTAEAVMTGLDRAKGGTTAEVSAADHR